LRRSRKRKEGKDFAAAPQGKKKNLNGSVGAGFGLRTHAPTNTNPNNAKTKIQPRQTHHQSAAETRPTLQIALFLRGKAAFFAPFFAAAPQLFFYCLAWVQRGRLIIPEK
jgi:hypothetical protein